MPQVVQENGVYGVKMIREEQGRSQTGLMSPEHVDNPQLANVSDQAPRLPSIHEWEPNARNRAAPESIHSESRNGSFRERDESGTEEGSSERPNSEINYDPNNSTTRAPWNGTNTSKTASQSSPFHGEAVAALGVTKPNNVTQPSHEATQTAGGHQLMSLRNGMPSFNLGASPQIDQERHGGTDSSSGRPRVGISAPDIQSSTQELLGSGNVLIAPSFFSSLAVTKECKRDTSIAIQTDLIKVFRSERLQSGEEEEMLANIQNHYLRENRDYLVRIEWINRHWNKWVAAAVKKYDLRDAVRTSERVRTHNRSFESGVSAGDEPAATARYSQSLELPARIEVEASRTQAVDLDSAGLDQNGGILVPKGSQFTPTVVTSEASPITSIKRPTCHTPHVGR